MEDASVLQKKSLHHVMNLSVFFFWANHPNTTSFFYWSGLNSVWISYWQYQWTQSKMLVDTILQSYTEDRETKYGIKPELVIQNNNMADITTTPSHTIIQMWFSISKHASEM